VRNKACVFILLFIMAFVLSVESKDKKVNLPERYTKWLEEEVVYIITALEKEVFLKLQADRERDLFIEAFWKHRDPTPSSAENEFKKEHYRRINYANHFFGRGVPKPGWRTDRGRTYIILGEPNDIQRFEGKTSVYPTEVWFYQGKTNLGLPPGFYVVFFQEGGSGEYKLYSPLRNGPQALLTSYYGDPLDYLNAYEHLKELEPELADVSLTLIPGERAVIAGRPTMTSDILIQRIETTPVRQVQERYAQKFLEYKDIVEVEYSSNYIGNDSLVKILKDSSGIYFVHYAIEPERLSVNLYQNKYYTTLKLNGTVSNAEGKPIYQFEKDIQLEFNEEQMKQISRMPVSIRDMFPLIPGEFKLSVLVKNEVSKEFTSLESNLFINDNKEGLLISPLILGYRMTHKETSQDKLRPFEVGRNQLYFQANRVFLRKDNLVVGFQIHGLTQEFIEKGELRYTFIQNGKEFRNISKKLSYYYEAPNFVEQFSLDEFLPAHYRVNVSLIIDGQEVLYDSEEFDVTHMDSIPRPWVYSKLLPGGNDPIYSYLIGTQLFNVGKIQEARSKLEEAFQAKPDSIEFALNLARVYMALTEYGKIESLLAPFVDKEKPPPYEAFFILGRVYQRLGQMNKAIDIFDKAIDRFGLNTNLLNSIGECYFALGKPEEASVVWTKSLEINPNQPQIMEELQAIKEKK